MGCGSLVYPMSWSPMINLCQSPTAAADVPGSLLSATRAGLRPSLRSTGRRRGGSLTHALLAASNSSSAAVNTF